MRKIQFIIESDPANTSLVSAAIRGINHFLNIKDEDKAAIVLGVVETINNCIEHAYNNNMDEKINIDYEISEDFIKIKISDRGRTMEGDPSFEIPDVLVNENGRGWFIIGSCFDKVDYQSKDGSNIVTLIKMSPSKN